MLLPTCEESPTAMVGLRRTNDETPVFFFFIPASLTGALTCSATAVGGGGGATGFGGGGVFIDGIHMILFSLVLNRIVQADRCEVDGGAAQPSVSRRGSLFP